MLFVLLFLFCVHYSPYFVILYIRERYIFTCSFLYCFNTSKVLSNPVHLRCIHLSHASQQILFYFCFVTFRHDTQYIGGKKLYFFDHLEHYCSTYRALVMYLTELFTLKSSDRLTCVIIQLSGSDNSILPQNKSLMALKSKNGAKNVQNDIL